MAISYAANYLTSLSLFSYPQNGDENVSKDMGLYYGMHTNYYELVFLVW